ncbi:MAG: hydroxymyristoyl-ACP dehydratase [Burkholderiales bacterium]
MKISSPSIITGTGIDRNQIRALMPHAGHMCLLDRVLTWDRDTIVCQADSNVHDNPLRRRGRIGAACGIEYAAQAMALHGALNAAGTRQRAGVLASVRDTNCYVAALAEGTLNIEARLLLCEGIRVIYGFTVSGSDKMLLEGRAAVVLGPSSAD